MCRQNDWSGLLGILSPSKLCFNTANNKGTHVSTSTKWSQHIENTQCLWKQFTDCVEQTDVVVKRISITECVIRAITRKHSQTALSIVYLGYLINPALEKCILSGVLNDICRRSIESHRNIWGLKEVLLWDQINEFNVFNLLGQKPYKLLVFCL